MSARDSLFDAARRFTLAEEEARIARREFEAAIPLVKGPSTYTTACTCDSQLPGYHRMDCGVYA